MPDGRQLIPVSRNIRTSDLGNTFAGQWGGEQGGQHEPLPVGRPLGAADRVPVAGNKFGRGDLLESFAVGGWRMLAGLRFHVPSPSPSVLGDVEGFGD